MSSKIIADIEDCIRNNVIWQDLSIHVKQTYLKNTPKNYDSLIFNYSLKNQLRFKGNLVRHVIRNEQQYYELMIDKSVTCLCLFPYHLADIITKGLRVTPFNYYIDVLCYLLKNDQSYDTLPNFTAADCLRVLGIGRNEYLSIVSSMRTNSSKIFRRPNPINFLPKFPVHISIQPWWKIEVGYVLESDIKYVSDGERSLIDDLIDFGSHTAGQVNYNVIHSLYKKGLIYLDVPISGEDKICIPPLKNFVMNRVSGDYFENLLYKIFVSADEHMTISELAQMLQINLDTVKHAISLFCRLGFARKKCDDYGVPFDEQHRSSSASMVYPVTTTTIHSSWTECKNVEENRPEITPLNYHSLLVNENNDGFIVDELNSTSALSHFNKQQMSGNSLNNKINENTNNSDNVVEKRDTISPLKENKLVVNSNNELSDGYISSDYSIINSIGPNDKSVNNSNTNSNNQSDSPCDTSELEDITQINNTNNNGGYPQMFTPTTPTTPTRAFQSATNYNNETNNTNSNTLKSGKRIAFLFDSTLTAFLMMGNLSPGLKNHAVTMFEVGKLCDESMDTLLGELEKVSLIDAEGEGDVGRYFAHAVILRSTIIALRNVLNGGLDLLRLECLESLDSKTRDRVLEKKYKFIISAAPLTGILANMFTIPFFGQFYKSTDNTHIWTKMFYYHVCGYGPPSLFITKGTVIRSLPRLFLGYGKLLITIVHTDSFIINSENYLSLNDQLKNNCILVQGYGIRNPAEVRYEAFPLDINDPTKHKWIKHKGIEKLSEVLNLVNTCGYITLINTGVPDIGCENYDITVHLTKPKSRKEQRKQSLNRIPLNPVNNSAAINLMEKLTLNTENIVQRQQQTNIPDLTSPMDGSEITSFNITTSTNSTNNNTKSLTAIPTNINPSIIKSSDENFFAVTPPLNSSPSNVFRSDDCNELLEKELSKLDDNNNNNSSDNDDKQRTTLVSQSSIEITFDNNFFKSNDNLQIIDEILPDNPGEDWTILDVNFGTPLFDVDCNTRICEYLVRNLCNDENLNNLQQVNTEMNKKFLKFISQCLYFEDENMEYIKIGKLIPQPRINLAFENGKICYWNGK